MLTSAFICPHAPVMIPSIGEKGGLQGMSQTINSVLSSCIEIAATEPDTVVIMSQRAYILPDSISVQVPSEEEFFGSMAEFGEEDCVLASSNNDLATRILNTAHNENLKVMGQDNNALDYGMLIPLYYLQRACERKFKVVALAMSLESKQKHFEFGKLLSQVFQECKEHIVFIAASELSHTVTKDAPQGYEPDAKNFDAHAVKYLKGDMVENFLLMDSFDEDEFFCHGLRPISTLLGALTDTAIRLKDISYEAPYGVGYLTALYK